MDRSKTKKNIIKSQSFTVTQSHTGTSESNVMVHIEVIKRNVSCIEFPKKDEFFVLTYISG